MIVLHHIPDHSYDVIIVHLIAGHYRIVIFIILHVFCHSVDVQASEPFPLQKQLQGVKEHKNISSHHPFHYRDHHLLWKHQRPYLHGLLGIISLTNGQACYNVFRLHTRLPEILSKNIVIISIEILTLVMILFYWKTDDSRVAVESRIWLLGDYEDKKEINLLNILIIYFL